MIKSVMGRLRAARIAIAAVTAMGLLTVGCSTAPRSGEPPATGTEGGSTAFDTATLGWSPSALDAHLPGIVGWRQPTATGPGMLVVASKEGSPAVVWEAPDGVACRAVGLDASRGTLACVVGALDGREFAEAAYLLGADGSVTDVALPDGYDTLSSFAFLADGSALALVTRYGAESIESTIGLVARDGSWSEVALAGTLPAFQFVENLFAIPASDKIAVVLKTQGSPADRDDEALVIASYSAGLLTSLTPAYREDSLPNAVPLWGETGVLFVRTWGTHAPGEPVADLVKAVFANGQWQESVLVKDGDITTGIESGTVAVAGPDGLILVRSAGAEGEPQGSHLLQVGAAGVLTDARIDVADISGLLWYVR
ncbi:MAG: hypothetical protein WBI63_08815 [Coriobacteriia bacterium]